MVRIISLAILLIISSLSFAGNESNKFQEANSAYSEGNYELAKTTYLELIEDGYFSEDLYYNLGNTFYKLDNAPSAILYFEKAKKINPANEAITHNLKLANARIVDKSPVKEDVSLSEWTAGFLGKEINSWANLSLVLFIVSILSFAVVLSTSKFRWLNYIGLSSIALSLVALLLANTHYNQLNTTNAAIITDPSIELMTEPSDNAGVAFILHEGSKVTILNDQGEWNEIKFADGKIGWLKSNTISKI